MGLFDILLTPIPTIVGTGRPSLRSKGDNKCYFLLPEIDKSVHVHSRERREHLLIR
ncbi:MAG: hypothetical protein JWQ85_3695 [Mucilaginibacter sp.]|nr:hypothetical protein [Mucilaginibacter sp.]